MKQGQKDLCRVTLTLHRDRSASEDDPQPKRGRTRTQDDAVAATTGATATDEILHNIALRNRKNTEYILNKLSRVDGGWNFKGEFVYKGEDRGGVLHDRFVKNKKSLQKENLIRTQRLSEFFLKHSS